MNDKIIKISIKELKKIVSEEIAGVKSSEHIVGRKPEKDVVDQRSVTDSIREAISNAINENIKERVINNVDDDIMKYSDVEIIFEPPKTLVRFIDAGGIKDQDMIYLINVTKIV